jgi:hypothetical protein
MKVVNIAVDGLPNMDDPKLIGRVAFIFDGCVVSGWPLPNGNWEANDDVGLKTQFSGVKKYIIFDEPIWMLSEDEQYPKIDNDALRFSEWLMENCELAEDNSLWSFEGEDYTQQGLYRIYRSEIDQVQIIQADPKLGRIAWRALNIMCITGAAIVGWSLVRLFLKPRYPALLLNKEDKTLVWTLFAVCLGAGIVYMYCITKATIQEYKQTMNRNEAKHQEYLDQEQKKYNKQLEREARNFGGL